MDSCKYKHGLGLLPGGAVALALAGSGGGSVVRLFTPDAHATWLLAALDPADGDTACGLCDVGIGMPEIGHVRLSELASIVGPRKQSILRDRCTSGQRDRYRSMRSWLSATVRSSTDRTGWPIVQACQTQAAAAPYVFWPHQEVAAPFLWLRKRANGSLQSRCVAGRKS